ncbi:MAG TPA: PAS domain S-box protein [Gallionella sp.]|nr:PAS domain S-box protein [Gallionella sp.]
MNTQLLRKGWFTSIPRFKKDGIAAALLIRVLLFSTAITLILTILQLTLSYRSEMASLQSRIDEINEANSRSLSKSLWALDDRQLQDQLDGILLLPSIRAVEVRETGSSVHPFTVSRGERQTARSIVKEFPLVCCGESRKGIGILRVEATLTDLYRNLASQAFVILLSNAAKTLLVAMFMLFVMHRLVTRHLLDIAAAVGGFAPEADAAPLHLRRLKREDDELDQLVDSLNAMRAKLRQHAAELETANTRMASILDNIPDFAWVKDASGRFVAVNRALAAARGFSDPRRMIGKTDFDVQPQDLAEAYRADDAALMALGGSKRFEELYVNADGVRTWFETIKTALHDGSGRALGTVGIARDITARKAIEEQLSKREEEFRTLVEHTPDIIIRYGCDCRRMYVNKPALQLMGATAAELLGRTPVETPQLGTAVSQAVTRYVEQVLASGESCEYEGEFVVPGGRKYAFHTRFVPEFDSGGEVVSILAIARDISSVKQMEAKLRKSELEFRTLAENSPEIIVRYDRECRRIYVNPAHTKFTGISKADVLHRTPVEEWGALFPREEYVARLKQVMETGQSERMVLEWPQPDGSLLIHDAHAVAEYDAHGHVVGVLVIGHNITELKSTERRLQASSIMLRELAARNESVREEERKRIARELHDELGQILNAMRINTLALNRQFGPGNPQLQAQTQDMLGHMDRTVGIVRDVVSALRPSVLNAGIWAALDWLTQEFSNNTGITCDLWIEREVTLDDEQVTAIFRIVQESLTNVMRHSGADLVEISLTLEHDGAAYLLKITDNGKGFDPDQPRKQKSLGLVGMQERVIMLGGTFAIFSALQQGTVLQVTIPVLPDSLKVLNGEPTI